MASNTMSPRQKMINMMYLVLIAILALNVSKDLLKAFVTFDEGLDITLANTASKNNSLYNALDRAKSLDPVKAGEQWEKAQKIKVSTSTTLGWIDSLSIRLIAETEGIELQEADTMALRNVEGTDNIDVPTNIMIGSNEDASLGEARKLYAQLIGHYSDLRTILGDDLSEGYEIQMDTNGIVEDGVKLNWELSNFFHTPLAASVALLTKFENDVRNLEYEALERLHFSIGERDLPFDTVSAKVISHSDYVLLGDPHMADVFIAAYSTTKDPEVELFLEEPGSVSRAVPIQVANGSGMVELASDRIGLHKYSGTIRMFDPSGQPLEFPFEHEYLVARPSVTVSPSKMNVFYRGIENPIDISVPGFANQDVRVSISGGNTVRTTGNGTYEVNMSTNSPAEVKVFVSVITEDGEQRKFGEKDFRVKRLPDPYAIIGDIKVDGTMSRSQVCAYSGLKGEYEKDFTFELTCEIISFQVMHVQRNGTVIVHQNQGQRFEPNIKELLCASRRGDKIYFEKIRARGKDGIRKLRPLFVTIR